MEQRSCPHLADPKVTEPSVDVCEECVAQGSGWVHLRLCLECGHVGCCDSSPNRHARQHYHSSGHPAVRSIQPGESWAYCFADDFVSVL
jgi:uncharacterized UBP type Zn finger protein